MVYYIKTITLSKVNYGIKSKELLRVINCHGASSLQANDAEGRKNNRLKKEKRKEEKRKKEKERSN